MNAKVAAFYEAESKWQHELLALREIIQNCPLEEEFKWRMPVYTFQQNNILGVYGLKDSCALSFFKGSLLLDEKGLLQKPGEIPKVDDG